MALPKISHPVFETKLPVSQQVAKYRPMLVKEEKILLVAKQSGDRADIFNAVAQIITNCLVSGPKPEAMSLCDMEYLYAQIRANSVGNIIKVSYIDNEDEKQYDFDLDLTKIGTTEIPTKRTFELPGNINLALNFPAASLYLKPDFYNLNDSEAFDRVLTSCMFKIYQNDSVFTCSEVPADELKAFIDNIPAKSFGEIREFLAKTPTLSHTFEYKNSKGTERKINLTSLEDFFLFG